MSTIQQLAKTTTYQRAHIDVLPTEILSKIFISCLHSGNHSPATYGPPVVLSRVCGRWRELSLALPALWSRFGSTSSELECPRSWTRLWLDRSRAHPLDLFIRIDLETKPMFLRTLIHRIGRLSITLPDRLRIVPDIAFEDAPLMRCLIIRANECDAEAVCRLAQRINLTPVLQELDLSIDLKSRPRHLFRWPHLLKWPHLSHVKLKFEIPLDKCIAFLAGCPHIISFNTVVGAAEGEISAHHLVVLPYLSSLTVMLHQDAPHFLDFVVLPSLQTLDIRIEYPGVRRYADSLMHFLSHSTCNLKTFFFTIPEEYFSRCIGFASLSSLCELFICNWGDISDFTLKLLTHPGPATKRGVILPNLQFIDMAGCRTSDGMVSKMIASRLKPVEIGTRRDIVVAPLKHVDVSFCGYEVKECGYFPCHDRDEDDFRKYRGMGLNIIW